MSRNPELSPRKRILLDLQRLKGKLTGSGNNPLKKENPHGVLGSLTNNPDKFRFRASVGFEVARVKKGIEARVSVELDPFHNESMYLAALNMDPIARRTIVMGVPETHPNFAAAKLCVEKNPNIDPDILKQMYNIPIEDK